MQIGFSEKRHFNERIVKLSPQFGRSTWRLLMFTNYFHKQITRSTQSETHSNTKTTHFPYKQMATWRISASSLSVHEQHRCNRVGAHDIDLWKFTWICVHGEVFGCCDRADTPMKFFSHQLNHGRSCFSDRRCLENKREQTVKSMTQNSAAGQTPFRPLVGLSRDCSSIVPTKADWENRSCLFTEQYSVRSYFKQFHNDMWITRAEEANCEN